MAAPQNIPVNLSVYVLQSGAISAFALYLFTKFEYSGQFKATRLFWAKAAKQTGLSEITARRGLKWLVRQNWIGFNSRSEIYHIRGYSRICHDLQIDERKSHEFHPYWLNDVCSFICHAAIDETKRRLEKKLNRVARPDMQNLVSNPGRVDPILPISTRYLSKALEVSKSTAQRYKACAAQGRHAQIDVLGGKPRLLKGVPPEAVEALNESERGVYRQSLGVSGHSYYFTKGGKVYQSNPDLIQTNLKRRKRKARKKDY